VVSQSLPEVAVKQNQTGSKAVLVTREKGGQSTPKSNRTLNRALQPNALPIYEAARLFKERCLKTDTSLLWPGSQAWTLENLGRIQNVFFRNPAEPGKNFVKLWKAGLSGESKDAHRVAADLMALYLLFPADLSRDKKMQKLLRVIQWELSAEQPDLRFLESAYQSFIGTTGRIYFARVHQQMNFFVAFATVAKRERIDFDNLAAVKRVAAEVMVGMQYVTPGRNVLLHLLFPKHVEGILSQRHRRKIVEAFPEFPDTTDDRDATLEKIRSGLTDTFKSPTFDYYHPNIRSSWDVRKTKTKIKKGCGDDKSQERQPERPRAWIFQSSPKLRDLASEMRSASSLSWPLKQFRGEVKTGDRVYLWESGTNGGVVGVAEISDLSQKPAAGAEQMNLGFAGSAKRKRDNPRRAMLKLLQSIDPALQRKVLISDEALANLSILRHPRGTNFPVTAEEAGVFDRMLQKRMETSSLPAVEKTLVFVPPHAA